LVFWSFFFSGELENTENFELNMRFPKIEGRMNRDFYLIFWLIARNFWLNLPGKIASLATNKIRKEKES
jgi:hypothetical protein